jgi:chromosome segregation ATPase
MGLFSKKQSIDPVEFLVLRNELVELKERLDASEQAKASLEDRLSSLAATTMVLSSNSKSDTAEIVEKIESLENRLETTLAVGSKVDELHQRVIDVEQGGAGSGGRDIEPRLAELSNRLDQVAELAAAPVAPDDELAGRLDNLSRSAETVDLLQRQVGQINARMSAQADIVDQVTALSDRIGLLQQRNVDSDRINQRLDELTAAGSTTELSERLALLGQRVAASEEASRAAAEQAATRAEIDAQLQAQALLALRVADIDTRLAQIDGQGADVSSLREIVELRSADVAGLRELIDVRSAEIADVRAQLEQVRTAAPADSGPLQVAQQLGQQLGELAERVAMTAEDARSARERANSLAEQARLANEQAAALAQQLAETGDRTGRVDQQISEIWSRLVGAEEQTRSAQSHAAAIEERLNETSSSVSSVAATTSQSNSDEIDRQLAELRQRLDLQASLPDRLTALDQRLAAMPDRGSDIQQLQERINELAASVPDTGGLSAQLTELSQRVSSSEGDARAALAQANALDERIQSVSTQLANQLGELSRDMDSLATRQPAAATVQIDDQALQTLRTGQVKLATEQARYEISFREDLAMLAEQVRQLRGRG